VPPEHLRPRARQRDLAHGGGGLAILELQRPGRQLEHGAPERDRSRGDYEHVALASMQLGDVSHERGEPRVVQAPAIAVDQQRGADLHHQTAEIGEGGRFAGHAEGFI
jgi:hypothetical protein